MKMMTDQMRTYLRQNIFLLLWKQNDAAFKTSFNQRPYDNKYEMKTKVFGLIGHDRKPGAYLQTQN